MAMREHRPETLERLGRNTDPELGNVSLQIRTDEYMPPHKARLVVACKKAAKKATALPEHVNIAIRGRELLWLDGRHFQVNNAARQTLPTLVASD